MATPNQRKVMHLSIGHFPVLASILLTILVSCKATDAKKECVAEDKEQCEELRINEGNGYSYYALGDTTIRATTGLIGASDRLTFEIGDPASVNTCGGTLASRVYHWGLKKIVTKDGVETIEQWPRKSLTSLQYVSLRTKEVVPDRNTTLFAIVARSVPTAKLYYLDSAAYSPNGASAEGEKNVDFNSREVDATYYLVQSPTPLSSACLPLPPQDPSEDPDHQEELDAAADASSAR